MSSDQILKNMKILYVEDDEEAREELADVLKRRAGKLFIGENGRRGLELYNDFEPDIILADFYMPEMDGIEMIREIRRQGGNPSVIVISAVNEVQTILSAIDAGIDKYVLKPVNMAELLEAVTELAEAIYSEKHKHEATLPENKKKIEDEIKREFAALLKTMTGKGPRDVSVFMNNERIELVASEVLTIFEKNLLDNCRNIAIIKYVREIFFSAKTEEICRLILRISGRRVTLSDVVVNVEKDKNKLIFTIDRDG